MNTNKEALARMKEDMQLRGLSPGTQYEYLLQAEVFLKHCNRDIEEIDEQDIRKYIAYLINERKLAASTVNLYRAAICFLFAITLNKNLNYRQIPNMKKEQNIPVILTSEEVVRLFRHELNLRNKAILMTVYSAGLRVSEVCNLKVSDIDSKSMRIKVRNGKGGKDRHTILSQKNLDILREYWQEYRVHLKKSSDGYLFLSKTRNTDHLSKNMVQYIFKAAIERAGIKKDVSIHVLRACFATHLLESGMDIFRIKQLLGHSCIKSTIAYLRLIKFDDKYKSPLDFLDMEGEEDI